MEFVAEHYVRQEGTAACSLHGGRVGAEQLLVERLLGPLGDVAMHAVLGVEEVAATLTQRRERVVGQPVVLLPSEQRPTEVIVLGFLRANTTQRKSLNICLFILFYVGLHNY